MNTAKSCIMQTGVETNVKFLSHKGLRPGNLSSVSLLLLSKSICYPFLSCLFVLLPLLLLLRLQSCLTLCDPIDGSPPGSNCPQDSPGKNTGVGCHFLLQCMKVKSKSEVAQSCPTLSDRMDCSLPGTSVHGIFQARVLEWGVCTIFFNFLIL